MTIKEVYECDATGETIEKDEAVGISVLRVRSSTEPGGYNDTRVEKNEDIRNSDHVSQEILDQYEFQTEDFNKLEIIVLNDTVVGWKDYNPYVDTSVQTPTESQRQFLRDLTYLK